MSKKIAVTSLFTAFAVILSYIETFIPVVGIPGVKLGLANFSIVLALYLLGDREALIINVVRILLVGFMFGNMFAIVYSLAGAGFSYIIMVGAKKINLSIVTVAILGGVFHNIGQMIVAGMVVETYSILAYVPVLMFSGIITGMLIGILGLFVYNRVHKYIFKEIGRDIR
ncbi:MAG: Gx transporter family protein [Eubacterium sp.]|nr:Gx transporter family protein [Eubacterium sp.]